MYIVYNYGELQPTLI